MTNRVIKLVIIAGFLSAALLFAGTTVMGKYSPVLASSLNVLVSNSGSKTSTGGQPVRQVSVPDQADPLNSAQNGGADDPADDMGSTSVIHLNASTTQTPLQAIEISIAALARTPEQYKTQLISLTGIITLLGNEKLLINDGTGQMIVDVEDEHLYNTLLEGKTLTITGLFDPSDSGSSLEVKACSITDGGETTLVDDCSLSDNSAEDNHDTSTSDDDSHYDDHEDDSSESQDHHSGDDDGEHVESHDSGEDSIDD